ncbi:metallophosphoesterase [Bacillus sp. CECT 9360]|uniref:metallophosphoesterase n=1 Tax=Bacillus sp. CECT 9360 TaxID=2845821 RepID=UPI001E5023CB|nr:metallophosphoesterase [Bacillus sp. CECT 9360]CAH0347656.1 hypothetical protein BCI9360_04073 [Bacillus sp. CECT 9360]
MSLGNILMIIAVFLLYNLLLFYIGWNIRVWLRNTFGFQKKWPIILAMLFLGYSFVLGRFTGEVAIINIIGSYWMGVIQYSLLLFPIANLVVFLVKKFSSLAKSSIVTLAGYTLLLCFVVIFAYGTYNAYTPVVRSYDIKVDKQVKGADDLRVVMASDMHFGIMSGKSHAKRMVKEIKQLEPDMVLYVGDIIDDDPTPFIDKKIDSDLAQVKAPLGTFAVLGNHEYYGGKIPEFVEKLEDIDIHVLRDEVVELDNGISIIGRKDKTDTDRQPVEELVSNVNQNNALFLLDHQPYELGTAEKNGIDLVVSGHTHRGQLAPNHLITKFIYENDWGYLQKEDMHSIVSSGFGFWGPPLRLGSQAEIVEINITFSN